MNTLIEISNPVYYVICGILSILVLAGIAMMSKVKSAARGNALSAAAMGLGVIVTLLKLQVVTFPWLIGGILIGGVMSVHLLVPWWPGRRRCGFLGIVTEHLGQRR